LKALLNKPRLIEQRVIVCYFFHCSVRSQSLVTWRCGYFPPVVWKRVWPASF